MVIKEAHLWSTYSCKTKFQNQTTSQMGSSKTDFCISAFTVLKYAWKLLLLVFTDHQRDGKQKGQFFLFACLFLVGDQSEILASIIYILYNSYLFLFSYTSPELSKGNFLWHKQKKGGYFMYPMTMFCWYFFTLTAFLLGSLTIWIFFLSHKHELFIQGYAYASFT